MRRGRGEKNGTSLFLLNPPFSPRLYCPNLKKKRGKRAFFITWQARPMPFFPFMALDGGAILEVWLSKKIWGKRCLGKKASLALFFQAIKSYPLFRGKKGVAWKRPFLWPLRKEAWLRCIPGSGRGEGRGEKFDQREPSSSSL